MDSWYNLLTGSLPSISNWPLFAQALATVTLMFAALLFIAALFWLTGKLFAAMLNVKGLSLLVGGVGYMAVSFFAWSVWIFLPWSISGNLNIEQDGKTLTQSLWLFFATFLLINLLAKDLLEDLKHWPDEAIGSVGRTYQTALLVLPFGVPLILQLMRLKALKRRKERYLEIIKALHAEH
ncbi:MULTISPECIES: hypothetical protein [unclassified Marinobacterium]|jgi:hypothetical protein|uniref:hypothetical protein n=1 Tax=unclassified Marinobacterium TaxID=2644139 RepID=UPI001569553F|nr:MULTISPECIES: hypothetical protein [unclassified Marinobacterium]NRP14395.1 hypothetical protein [Marinobacterium sp. xm-a-152]NRP28714.1 hypothetical protein [Marinobacterium sp. xm-d-420]